MQTSARSRIYKKWWFQLIVVLAGIIIVYPFVINPLVGGGEIRGPISSYSTYPPSRVTRCSSYSDLSEIEECYYHFVSQDFHSDVCKDISDKLDQVKAKCYSDLAYFNKSDFYCNFINPSTRRETSDGLLPWRSLCLCDNKNLSACNNLKNELLPIYSNDDVAEQGSWKLFNNAELGFSLKHPSSWSEPRISGGGETKFVDFNNSFEIQVGRAHGQYSDPQTGRQLTEPSINEVIDQVIDLRVRLEGFYKDSNRESLVIDGRNATKVTYITENGAKDVAAYIPRNSDKDMVVIYADRSINPAIVSEVLSTFKFVK